MGGVGNGLDFKHNQHTLSLPCTSKWVEMYNSTIYLQKRMEEN
jgi:hypothetical protein